MLQAMYRIILLACAVAVIGPCATADATPGEKDAAKSTLIATFKDWRLECTGKNAGHDRCFIAQNLMVKSSGKRVMIFGITREPNQSMPVAVLTLPLGITLPPGIGLRVDGGTIRRFPVQRCLRSGCKTVFRLTPELTKILKAGLKAEVLVRDATGKAVALPVSLLGLTAALRALDARRPAPNRPPPATGASEHRSGKPRR